MFGMQAAPPIFAWTLYQYDVIGGGGGGGGGGKSEH